MGSVSRHVGTSFPVVEMCPPRRGVEGIPDGTYELGLACAGAISAGAYIAGVLDFLTQALDAWEAEKRKRPRDVPDHQVRLTVMTGASAGSICSGIFALLREKAFTPAAADLGTGAEAAKNPLFQAWVNAVDIDKLTRTDDLANGRRPVSLLDSSLLDRIGVEALADAATLPDIERAWVADPLRVYLTQTNGRGVPYFVGFTGGDGAGQGMVQYADQARFVFFRGAAPPVWTGGTGNGAAAPFPDETVLTGAPQPTPHWRLVPQAALASSAFPLGLAPREMVAKPEDYAYRLTVEHPPDSGIFMTVDPQGPDWPGADATGARPYLGFDGGVINNDPFGLAHEMMAGAYGTNPRDGDKAKRSIIMVDPFPERPAPGPSGIGELGLPQLAGAILTVLRNQVRFKAEDLKLAEMEGVFSRFIIVPKRRKAPGELYNLACGIFGGFGGFLARPLRLHDFLNGRRNCQKFLMHHLVLPRENPLFAGWRDQPFAKDYEVRDPETGEVFLPIVPLLPPGPGHIPEQPAPVWPVGAIDASASAKQIMRRVKALAPALLRLGWFWKLLYKAASWFAYPRLEKEIRNRIKAEAEEWRL